MTEEMDLHTDANNAMDGENENFDNGNTQQNRENGALGGNTQQDGQKENGEIEWDEEDIDPDANSNAENTPRRDTYTFFFIEISVTNYYLLGVFYACRTT
jgi:hypothetical protein